MIIIEVELIIIIEVKGVIIIEVELMIIIEYVWGFLIILEVKFVIYNNQFTIIHPESYLFDCCLYMIIFPPLI